MSLRHRESGRRSRLIEAEVSEAVAGLLARQQGTTVAAYVRPDEDPSDPRDVDAAFDVGEASFVLEHTVLEPYVGSISETRLFSAVLLPLQDEMAETALPTPGHFKLVAFANDLAKAPKPAGVRAVLRDWVIETAPTLVLNAPPRHTVTAQPDGVPFPVSLSRWPGHDGEFRLGGRFAPPDGEELRLESARRALEKKCPKLERDRGGGSTVLVLETNDLGLDNAVDVGRAVKSELAERHGDAPDHIYLVETELESRWPIYAIRRDSVTLEWPEFVEFIEH